MMSRELTPRVRFTVEMDPEPVSQLMAHADARRISRSEMLRQIVEEWLRDHPVPKE